MQRITKQYINLCGGVNKMTSGMLMKVDELYHSTNAISDTIGILKKTLGHSLYWDLALPQDEKVTITIASPAVISLNSHGLNIGSQLTFETTGTLPTGIGEDITYYVIAAGFGANSFQISTAYNGTAVNTSVSQTGTHTINAVKSISAIQQVGTDVYALAGTNLYRKNGTGKTVVATDVKVGSSLVVMMDHLFYINTAGAIQSCDSSAEDNEHLKNAPASVNFIASAKGRMYAFCANRFYEASPIQRVVCRVIGDHTAATIINVDTTKYLKATNVFDSYNAAGDTKGNDSKTIATVASLTSFTVAAPLTFKDGDVIVYEDGVAVDTIMWAAGEDGDWWSVFGDDGDPVGAVDHGGSMVIIKSQSLWRYTGTALTKIADVGTSSPKTFKIVGKLGIFANTDHIYVLDANDVSTISWKVDEYLKGLTAANVPYWSAGVDGTKYRLWIGDTTTENTPDCEIVLDTNSWKYDIRSYVPAISYGNLVLSSVIHTYIGTNEGQVLQLDSGLSYNGDAIEFLAKTKQDNVGLPGIIKQFYRVKWYTIPGTILDVYYSVDEGEFQLLGQITTNNQSFQLTDITGVEIQFLLSEFSKDDFPGVYGYELSADYDEEV